MRNTKQWYSRECQPLVFLKPFALFIIFPSFSFNYLSEKATVTAYNETIEEYSKRLKFIVDDDQNSPILFPGGLLVQNCIPSHTA